MNDGSAKPRVINPLTTPIAAPIAIATSRPIHAGTEKSLRRAAAAIIAKV